MKNRIEKLLAKRNGGKKEVTTSQGIEAILKCAEIAEANGIEWAIAGGIAVQIYGFTRATMDADALASAVLPLQSNKELSFGGESYLVQIESGEIITVDWLVRDDDYAEVYEAALNDAEPFSPGINIITPEWLTIIKHLAGRGKDELDLMWLLREPNLVDRDLVREHLRSVYGRFAYGYIKDIESQFLYADFMKERDERGE